MVSTQRLAQRVENVANGCSTQAARNTHSRRSERPGSISPPVRFWGINVEFLDPMDELWPFDGGEIHWANTANGSLGWDVSATTDAMNEYSLFLAVHFNTDEDTIALIEDAGCFMIDLLAGCQDLRMTFCRANKTEHYRDVSGDIV